MRDIEPGSMVFSFNAPVNSVLFFPLPDTATLPDAIDGLTLIASAGNAKLYQVKGPDAIEFRIERTE